MENSAGKDLLTVLDSRTDKTYHIPIVDNSISASDISKIKAPDSTQCPTEARSSGLLVFDEGFRNTALIKSGVVFVDAKKGVIEYRGYPVADLTRKRTFIEVSHLLIWGELPTTEQLSELEHRLAHVPKLKPNVHTVISAFPRDAPLVSMIAAGLLTVQSTMKEVIPAYVGKAIYQGNFDAMDREIINYIANLARVVAMAICHQRGRQFQQPDTSLPFVENVLHMMGHVDQVTGRPNPLHAESLGRLWIALADMAMINSTVVAMATASSQTDIYTMGAATMEAASGILHGGAIALSYRDLADIGTVENVPAKLEAVKAGKQRLNGFGHRAFKGGDPRVAVVREVFERMGDSAPNDPLLAIAFELDQQTSKDPFFVERGIRPNSDLLAAFSYKAMGFHAEEVFPLATISRTPGMLGHWRELMSGPPRLWSAKSIYLGSINKTVPDQPAFQRQRSKL